MPWGPVVKDQGGRLLTRVGGDGRTDDRVVLCTFRHQITALDPVFSASVVRRVFFNIAFWLSTLYLTLVLLTTLVQPIAANAPAKAGEVLQLADRNRCGRCCRLRSVRQLRVGTAKGGATKGIGAASADVSLAAAGRIDSSNRTIPKELLSRVRTIAKLGDVDSILSNVLHGNGYVEQSYYAVPDGFALVTKLDQINTDGTSKALPDRWSIAPANVSLSYFSLRSYLPALFTAAPGDYRLIVLL